MTQTQEFKQLLKQDFGTLVSNSIIPNDTGGYDVFDKYTITQTPEGYSVTCYATDIGVFSSTKTALSWCIADKYSAYNTARQILQTDRKLTNLRYDIAVRASLGDRANNENFRDTILTKLETKIIHKKILENQLAKCVNWAKYIQQRGFENETQRIGRNQPNKTSR